MSYKRFRSRQTERQELFCHNCNHYVQFDIDRSKNGKYVFNCPECGHEHCRIVHDGIISDERWESRNPVPHATFYIVAVSSTSTSINASHSLYYIASGTATCA